VSQAWPVGQPEQAAPAAPHAVAVSEAYRTHAPLAVQHPFGHDAALQTHWPAESHAWPVAHTAHAIPRAPQCAAVDVSHAPALVQQPVVQPAPHAQLPAVQACPTPHAAQATPPVPHAPAVVPSWQTPLSSQHPAAHVVGLHVAPSATPASCGGVEVSCGIAVASGGVASATGPSPTVASSVPPAPEPPGEYAGSVLALTASVAHPPVSGLQLSDAGQLSLPAQSEARSTTSSATRSRGTWTSIVRSTTATAGLPFVAVISMSASWSGELPAAIEIVAGRVFAATVIGTSTNVR
jgi:hypothetical protein